MSSLSRTSLLFLVYLASCASPAPKLSLAYINSGKVMQQYHGTAAKRAQLEAQARIWQHSLDSISLALDPRLTPAEHEKRLMPYRATYQNDLQKASQLADQELLKEVNKYLQTFGKARKYDLIFGANDSGNIVYATANSDLTEEVIQELNQQYDKLHPANSATPGAITH